MCFHQLMMWPAIVIIFISVLLWAATEDKVSDSYSGERSSLNLPKKGFPDNSSELDNCVCVPYYLCNGNDTISDEVIELIDIAINEGGCNSYLQKSCARENVRPSNDPLLPQPRPVETNTSCGNRNIEGIDYRISKLEYKKEAKYGEFPWMVAVIISVPDAAKQGASVEVYQCGGSLIHSKVVLTAAHCVRGKTNLIIRAGEWDTQTTDELYPTQDRRVTEVIVHEQYSARTLASDVALLILESPVDMSVDNVGLICLPDPNENMDDWDCFVNGWGKDLYGKEGKYSVVLKSEDTKIVPHLQCQNALRKTRLGSNFTLDESFICAGGEPGNGCMRDGGAPLTCSSPNNAHIYVQSGIVAWSIGCDRNPSVYVNVPHFVNWINDKMQEKNIS